MSVEEEKLPPAPFFTSVVSLNELTKTYILSPQWQSWHTLLTAKVNAIDSSLVGLSQVVGNGAVIRNPDGSWSTTGATAVGEALLAIPNPSAIRFIRINADNTVTALSNVNFTTALTGAPAVTGSRGGNVALGSLLTTLAAAGLITDSTTV